MKQQKKLVLKINCVLLSILVFIIIVSGFRVIKPETTSQTDGSYNYERELNTLIVELEEYWKVKTTVIINEIKDEILAYKDNTDLFLDEMYSIRVQFGSMGRKIGEWFSSDKERVEKYLKTFWDETMFSEEDINHLVNKHIYEALNDLNKTSSNLLEEISVSVYEDNIQKREEFRQQLIKVLETYKKFDFYHHQTARGMLKNSGRVLGTSIGAGFVIDIALSTTIRGTTATAGVIAGPATLGISIAAGLVVDWALEKISKDKAREEVHKIVEDLSESVSKKVYHMLSIKD